MPGVGAESSSKAAVSLTSIQQLQLAIRKRDCSVGNGCCGNRRRRSAWRAHDGGRNKCSTSRGWRATFAAMLIAALLS